MARKPLSLSVLLFIIVAWFVVGGLSPAPVLVHDAWTAAAAPSTFAYDGEQHGYDQPAVLAAGLASFDSGQRRGYDERVNPVERRTDAYASILAAKGVTEGIYVVKGARGTY